MSEKEYNIGDKVWWATCNTEQVQKTCPVCYGKKCIVVILGNDEKVQCPCEYCSVAFSPPLGFVKEYERVSDVKQIVIDGKEVKESNKGKEVEYRYCCYILRDETIADTKEEAEEKLRAIIEKLDADDARRNMYCKEQKIKSYSWHVGYHKRQLKKAEENVAYHKAKIVAMKEKADLHSKK